MTRPVALLALAFTLTGCATASRHPADILLEDLHARGLFQGAVVLGPKGQPTYARGFGFADVDRRVAFTPDTPNDGGSIAKTFTAAALLSLVAEGRANLDDPVRKHVPAYPHDATRLRHLLAHAAGLPGYGWLDTRFPPGSLRTNASQLEAVARERPQPAFPPGDRFRYDNVAYDVAAMAIEAITGRAYEAELQARYFRPLGLSAFIRPARFAGWPGVRTRGYRRDGAAFTPHDAIEGEGFHGAGNAYLSARDAFLWAGAMASRVPAPARALGRAPVPVGSSTRRFLGLDSWYRDSTGERRYYTGHHEGFHNFMYADDRRGIAVAFVSNDTMPAWLQPALARALVAIAEGRAPEALVPPLPGASASVEGRYQVEGLGEVQVRGKPPLAVTVEGVEYTAYPVDGGTHYIPGLDAYLRFTAAPRTLAWDSVFRTARGVAID